VHHFLMLLTKTLITCLNTLPFCLECPWSVFPYTV